VPEPILTSHRNPRFREVLALREGSERRSRRQFLVDGAREIERAIVGGVRPVEAWVSSERVDQAGIEAQHALAIVRDAGAAIVEASPELIARLAYGDRGDGIVLVAHTPSVSIDTLELGTSPLIAVVEGVEKPGNLGAMLRSADGAGVDALIVADPGTDPFNPNVIRASLGTVFSVPIAVASSGVVLEWLIQRGTRIIAARVEGSVDFADADYTSAVAIALGSEARGLSDAWAELATTAVRLPMLGIADSLNVSATAAVLFYEALRQRRAVRATEPREADPDV
jgi:TrmH family RNA methyltransferase